MRTPLTWALLVASIVPQSLQGATFDAAPTNDVAAPIVQRFITQNASVIESDGHASCRVFQAIDVRASHYTAATGADVPFSEVLRSPASGVWIIWAPQSLGDTPAPIPQTGVPDNHVRVVLKYPVQTLNMIVGDATMSLTEYLDRAGDSATLPPDPQAALMRAWQSGQDVVFRGVSRDTGRTMVDRVRPASAEDRAACADFQNATRQERLEALELPPSVATTVLQQDGLGPLLASNQDVTDTFFNFVTPSSNYPRHGPISVTWAELLPGHPDKTDLIGCRMTDLGGEIERYRLAAVTGFVSSSGEVWITRDRHEQIRQVYIPGVFEALRDPNSQDWVADVSIGAFANDPFVEPVFKGCLGSQKIAMGGAQDGLVEQLALEDLLENFAFTSATIDSEFDSEGPVFLGGEPVLTEERVNPTPRVFQPPSTDDDHWSHFETDVFFLHSVQSLIDPFDPTGPLVLTDEPNFNSPLADNPAPVPLPVSFMLLLSALGLLAAAHRRT